MKEGFSLRNKEQKNRNRSPNKFAEHKAALAGAIMAALSGSGTPAEAQSTQVRSEKTVAIATMPKSPSVESQSSLKDLAWFTNHLYKEKITPDVLRQLEDFVINDWIPLSEQIVFMTMMLQEGGLYDRKLKSLKTTEKVISEIYKSQSIVSARLTLAYENDRNNPILKKYFAIDDVVASARVLEMTLVDQKTGKLKTINCNGFLAFFNGDVYLATADHCVLGTKQEKEFKRSPGSDQAVKYIPPTDYKAWNITDPSLLPNLSPKTRAKSPTGGVVVNYSLVPTANMSEYVPEIHFSFAMVQPAIYQIGNQDKSLAQFANSGMFFKPPTVGKILEQEPPNPDGTPGKVMRVHASGSSGSLVAVYDGKGGFIPLGPLQIVGILADKCAKLCYGTGYYGSSVDLYNAMSSEQQDRVLAGLPEAPTPKVVPDPKKSKKVSTLKPR